MPSETSLLKVLGIVPDRKLLSMSRLVSDVIDPIVLGIVPNTELSLSVKTDKDVKDPMVLGSEPTKS